MTFQSELRNLAAIFPADSLVYVGGAGFDPSGMLQDVPAASAVIVMAAPEDVAEEGLDLPAGARLVRAVVTDRPGNVSWYSLSLSLESGLVPPQSLTPYWRNIELLAEAERPATTLDALAEAGRVPQASWLIVDMLAAGQVLAGGTRLLESVDVVIAKCLLQAEAGGLEQSAADGITAALAPFGFSPAARVPGRNAAVGHVVFVRNWKQAMAARLEEVEQLSQETAKTLEANRDMLLDQLQAKEANLLQLRAGFEEVTRERQALAERLDELSRDKQALSERVEALSRENEKQAEIIALIKDVKGVSEDARRKLSGVIEDVRDMRQLSLAAVTRGSGRMPDFLFAKAERAFDKGDCRRSAEYYQAVLETDPENAWAVQGLAESIARMEYSADVHWFGQDTAQAIEDTGKWDVTVRLYRKALALDPDISAAFSEVHPSAEHKDPGVPNPVFIVGCGHSGTSILLRILGDHPDLMPIPKESAIFLQSDQAIRKTMEAWDKECQAAGKQRWIEKTPPHIFQMRRFLQMRPQSQFILLLRDGRDVVHSLRHRVGYQKVEDRIERWVYDNVAGLPFWDHPQVKVVRYEDFVKDTAGTVTDIFSFLNVDASADVLGYHQKEARWYSERIEKPESLTNNEDHKGLRNWQINQPVFDGRAKWKDEMPESEREAFRNSKAQAFLEQFGYAENDGW